MIHITMKENFSDGDDEDEILREEYESQRGNFGPSNKPRADDNI